MSGSYLIPAAHASGAEARDGNVCEQGNKQQQV